MNYIKATENHKMMYALKYKEEIENKPDEIHSSAEKKVLAHAVKMQQELDDENIKRVEVLRITHNAGQKARGQRSKTAAKLKTRQRCRKD